jgi:hypothetical protein
MSLCNIPKKYNIIIHLQMNCSYHLLKNLQCSSLTSKFTLEYAYMLYTALLKRKSFSDYYSGQLKALANLVQYHIVIAAMISAPTHSSSSLTTAAMTNRLRASFIGSTLLLSHMIRMNSNEKHFACPDSPTLSVGIIMARLMELKPKKDHWQRIACNWYTQVVAEFPGHGKLLFGTSQS